MEIHPKTQKLELTTLNDYTINSGSKRVSFSLIIVNMLCAWVKRKIDCGIMIG